MRRCTGAFFSIFTTILVYMDYRFGGTKQTSEQVCSCNVLLTPLHIEWYCSEICAEQLSSD